MRELSEWGDSLSETSTTSRADPRALDVVGEIRRYDFADFSDLELKAALADERSDIQSLHTSVVAPAVYALVNEAIRRRLGAWRLFNSSIKVDGLEEHREPARQILASDGFRDEMMRHDADVSSVDDVAAAAEPILADMALDQAGESIVTAMVAAGSGGGPWAWSQLHLSAEFYQAAFAKDRQGALKFEPTDEQLLAGTLLFWGNVAEMNAGEGKTVVAAFPAVHHVLQGRAVHIITANDYLASRDAEIMAPVYQSLGLSVGSVLGYMSDREKRHQYGQDIVYGTMREFGFDYLRDNIRYSPDERVQGRLDVAIVDEADHALIDEAAVPLIISGSPTPTTRSVTRVRRAVEEMIELQGDLVRELEAWVRDGERSPGELAPVLANLLLADPENAVLQEQFSDGPELRKRVHSLIDNERRFGREALAEGLWYSIDMQRGSVWLTEQGQSFLEKHLGRLFDSQGAALQRLDEIDTDSELSYMERREENARLGRELDRQYGQVAQVYQMLRAYCVLRRDVDYVVADGAVVLIDALTGRQRPDSRYQRGLQSALEAKERVGVEAEHEAMAQISVQGFVKHYRHVSGMTGTASTAQREFQRAYGLKVVSVPPSQPNHRTDLPPRLYDTRQEKLEAVVDEIAANRVVGRPVLVGTLTVAQSEEISQLLDERRVPHNLLNAVSDEHEAGIIRAAGSFGSVTIATNMAGRGTDILLDPDLDGRVVQGYVDHAIALIRGGIREVRFHCHSRGEADILRRAFSAEAAQSVASEDSGDETEIVVTGRIGKRDAASVTLEFGLGLYVIGTELNDSRRVDLQLKGRAGRQGEFGATRFLVSLEDEFFSSLRDHSLFLKSPSRFDWAGRVYRESRRLTRHVEAGQARVERENEALREGLYDFAHVDESEALAYYRGRGDVMASETFHNYCDSLLRNKARELVRDHSSSNSASWWERLSEEAWADYGVDCSGIWELEDGDPAGEFEARFVARLEQRVDSVGGDSFGQLEKLLFLQTADELWRAHIADGQDAMLTVHASAHSHQGAVAEYARRVSREHRLYNQRVVDEFLIRLMIFPLERDAAAAANNVAISDEIGEILV